MITLPAGFDVTLLVSDFFGLALPFVGVAMLLAAGALLLRLCKKI
jgi:hypothetical protein